MKVPFITWIPLGLLLCSQLVLATTIDFEDLPVGTAIGFRYAANGVTFSQNVGIGTNTNGHTAPVPHSGTQLAQQFEGEFNSAPLSFDFTNGQTHVALYGCTFSPRATGVLKIFDATGAFIAQDGPKALTDSSCNTLFDLQSPSPNIKHVEFSAFDSSTNVPESDLEIDDLLFEGGAAPPPVPADTPFISITSPVDGSSVDATNGPLSGTVKGNGLIPQLLATVDHQRMPWDQVPPDAYSIPLVGTGTTLNFSQAIRLPFGALTITAKADNTGGKEGTATVTVTNLPAKLRNIDGSLGPLKGSLDASPTCRVAIYANGALAWDGNNVFTINATMLPKWTAWVSATWLTNLHNLRAYCPTEDAHVALGTTSRQNFVGGRLYDDSGNVYFVSALFAQAIDTLGGEKGTGTPVGDPQTAPAAHTWQFQRFSRPQGGLSTTMEIKGNHPVLYVERQGGDLIVLTNAGLPLTPGTATLVDQFPCSGVQGPCAIHPPTSGPRVGNAGDTFCKGTTFPGGPDEWVPIISQGHTTPVKLLGWVSDSRPAGADYPATHEFWQTHAGGVIWADWDLFVHPVEPFRNLLAGNDFMEVEFEYYPAQYFFIAYNGQPLIGDLYFAAGRWIIDCGHNDYASEIHPPFVSSRIRTEGAGDAAKTVATFWVNGYYYSGQQVDFQVFPPPRPTPTSFLSVSVPRASDAAVDVTVIDPTDSAFSDSDFAAFVLARFSATPRQVNIGYGGLLPFAAGRVYEGTWNVGWETETQYPVAGLSASWWP